MSTSKKRNSSSTTAAPAQRRRRPGVKSRPTVQGVADGAEDREQLIAEAAYIRSEQRNFEPGRELDDWLAAEAEIDSLRNLRRESIDEADNIGSIP